MVYLSFYNLETDEIENTLIVADFSDDFGNLATHSIIFPNNYVATTKIAPNVNDDDSYTFYTLQKINFDTRDFTILKSIREKYVGYNKAFENTSKVLGISANGELLELNHE